MMARLIGRNHIQRGVPLGDQVAWRVAVECVPPCLPPRRGVGRLDRPVRWAAVASLVERMQTGEFLILKQVLSLVILELWHMVFIEKQRLH